MLNRTLSNTTRSCICLITTASCIFGMAGCREETADEPYNRDLGDDSNILLPVGSPIMNAKVASGSAEFPEFRDPSEEPIETAPEDEIRELIQEFNDFVSQDDFEDLEQYFVRRQQEDVKALIDLTVTLFEKADELAEALTEAAPDQEERIERLLDETLRQQAEMLVPLIKVASLETVSETKVVGKLPPDEALPIPESVPEVHFEFEADEESGESDWYIVLPNLELQQRMLPQTEERLTEIDRMIEDLKAGSMPAEQVLSALEAQAQAAKAAAGDTEAAEAADEAETDEEADEGEEELTEDEEEGDEELEELDEEDEGEEEPEEEEEEPAPPPSPGG
ncbi:MAG: hypothetical protein JSV78_05110 [Phycisphaerales bacterium]|nr:MAG: hypothetical protein JSV78_05110 [Phycisphaerales bacterium]